MAALASSSFQYAEDDPVLATAQAIAPPDQYDFFSRRLTLWKAHPSLTAIYRLGHKVGSGTFGVVYTAVHRESNVEVALKHFKSSKWTAKERTSLLASKTLPRALVRELEFLMAAHCPYVLGLYDVLVPLKTAASIHEPPPSNVFMVCELAEFDLESFRTSFSINSYLRRQMSAKSVEDAIRAITFAMASALSTCYERSIVHCDIKPANALAFRDGSVKVSDFGLAKRIPIPGGYEPYDRSRQRLVSLWYRAPELALRFTHFSHKIDVWALGCSMAQLTLGTPLFRAKTEDALLRNIFNVVGSPDRFSWPECFVPPWTRNDGGVLYNSLLSSITYDRDYLAVSFVDRFSPYLSREGIDILSKMLILNPEQRISAPDILKHKFFAPIRKNPDRYQRYLSRVFSCISDGYPASHAVFTPHKNATNFKRKRSSSSSFKSKKKAKTKGTSSTTTVTTTTAPAAAAAAGAGAGAGAGASASAGTAADPTSTAPASTAAPRPRLPLRKRRTLLS